jgi:hypothetical protein
VDERKAGVVGQALGFSGASCINSPGEPHVTEMDRCTKNLAESEEFFDFVMKTNG